MTPDSRMQQSPPITPWYEVYQKLALQLQDFYRKHQSLSGQELFKLLNRSHIYKTNNSWLSNVSRIPKPSLEPIQLFTSFSRSRQQETIRQEIINAVWTLLTSQKKTWENIDFKGCPAPMALKLQYVRPEFEQTKIWEYFNDIIEKGKNALTSSLWDDAIAWRGIEIPSFTIFLFWINSNEFIPLDKNTRQYLEYTGFIPLHTPITFETYRALLNNNQITDYIKLSSEAFYFNRDPLTFKENFQTHSFAQKKEIIDYTFKFVGLRTLARNKTLHKILPFYQYYPLDHTIRPKDTDIKSRSILQEFHQKPVHAETLYNLENIRVNITAIVGKNGSGKSTLLDLVLMGIYNLSVQLGYLNSKENKPLKKLNFEIYWHTDTLYKIIFDTEIYAYRFKRGNYEDSTIVYELDETPIPIEKIKNDFFYTILVNYSHYALNSSEHSTDWITPLSHKNDGYIAPLVINPKRTAGDIDINTEKTLLNMRLLLNLLDLHDADIPEQSFRYIDNGKYLKYFSVTHNKRKNVKKRKEAIQQTYDDPKIIRIVMNQVANVFFLSEKSSHTESYKEELNYYIVNKLLAIVNRYDRYRMEYKEGLYNLIEYNIASTIEGMDTEVEILLENRLQQLLGDIKNDHSHITLKFKQAVYFLKYPALRKFLSDAIKSKKQIELDDYQQIISTLINSEEKENLTTAELLPPAIFKLDFYLDDPDKSSFSKVSSGEYQLLSVLSSILYHIRNIDSVDRKNNYNYVTVLLDEIELYFHPNMQRSFIRKLLESLSKLDNNLYGIHILFATHSPFILSDIHQQKILKLKNGVTEHSENGYNTFAANIHDLLADEFFLEEGYMGAFAQKQIEIAINLLNYIKVDNEIKDLSISSKKISSNEPTFLQQKLENELASYKEKLKEMGYWDNNKTVENLDPQSEQKRLYQLIEIIGEPLIQEKLRNMYRTAFPYNIEDESTSRTNAKQNILRLMRENNINLQDLQ
ncbi:AAA ATPase-like protein [Chitinophaga polysaccharea]|uniref:AAA ATPase-like protein n=1 Tax=Chitinophaga polysaccharea TaxID=1293035 RepID=A0A561PPJ2_9BACT|nr:AAA family ATPase [Chitinophaga polysaccharea]TWF40032.1 AAA ATPase-like protein [Chitinophaga polysaccharea]